MKTERQKQNDNVPTAVCLLAANCVFSLVFSRGQQKHVLHLLSHFIFITSTILENKMRLVGVLFS